MSADATDEASGISLDFVTPVWGETFTTFFLEVALRTFLAPANLHAVAGLKSSFYRIYTTTADAERIKTHPSFLALDALMPVEIHTFTGLVGNKYGRMSYCHKRAINLANERDAALVFLPPDAVAANGCISALLRLAHAGKRVVFNAGLRLHLEGASGVLRRYCNAETGAISVSSRELMRIALDNLHPITLKHIWDNDGGEQLPQNLFWRVGSEALIARCFHLNPLLVYPKNKSATFVSTIDDNFVISACPDSSDWHIVTDSDELLLCELSSVTYDIPGRPIRGIRTVVSFAEISANSLHRYVAHAPILLHVGTHSPAQLDASASAADKIMNAVFEALDIGVVSAALSKREKNLNRRCGGNSPRKSNLPRAQ